MRRSILVLPLILLAAPVAAEAPRWPATYLGRVELTAVMQTLNARLLASRSATATLEGWCGGHGMAAAPARLSARLVPGADKPAEAATRQRLGIGPDEPLRYRRVRLACGDRVLSEADNWYVPARLTPEMNRLLETTDTPFGRAVQPLGPTRQTVAADLLWQPLPEDWEQAAPPPAACGAQAVPEHWLRHRAVLFTASREPFSEVVETYTAAVLDFARAPRPADPACPAP